MQTQHSLTDVKANSLNATAQPVNFAQCISIGNTLVVTSFIVMVISILFSFFYDQHISLMTQVVAHISTIVSAGILKLGYVIRCVGAYGLGHKSF